MTSEHVLIGLAILLVGMIIGAVSDEESVAKKVLTVWTVIFLIVLTWYIRGWWGVA